MSARATDRHGFKLIDRTSTDNADAKLRWVRRWRHFCHIKRETEPRRQELVRAHWRLDRLNKRHVEARREI